MSTSRPEVQPGEAQIPCYLCGSAITTLDLKGMILVKCDRCRARQAALEYDLINRPGDDELK